MLKKILRFFGINSSAQPDNEIAPPPRPSPRGSKLDLERQCLYDGVESKEFYGKVYEIRYGEKTYTFSSYDFIDFERLKDEIPSADFNTIKKLFDIKVTKLCVGCDKYHIDKHMEVNYYRQDDAIVVATIGEFQPGRMMFILEGIYLLS